MIINLEKLLQSKQEKNNDSMDKTFFKTIIHALYDVSKFISKSIIYICFPTMTI
jgi:hypothetical protein